MDPNASLRNELLRDAANECMRLGKKPDAILVSGDIAFAGAREEYDYAAKWLEILCSQCDVPESSIFVIPGNHDVVRKVAARNLVQLIHRDIKGQEQIGLDAHLRGILTDGEQARLLYESIETYNQFAGRFLCDLLPPERTIAKRDLQFEDGSVLRLCGFNSAFVSSSADKEGDLFVDPACFQLERVPGVEYLTLCHHPFRWLRNGAKLMDNLQDIAKIQLFGHEHTNRIEVLRDCVRIAASAAHPDRAEQGWEPGYNLIDLSIHGSGLDRSLKIEVTVRVWQERPGLFRSKLDRGQSPVFKQSIALEAWSPLVAKVVEPTGSTSVCIRDGKSASDAASILEGFGEMDSIREVSVNFLKLTFSQKSAIAGGLDLFEEQDANLPDFERFRRVLVRAKERGKLENLARMVADIQRDDRSRSA